jgi:hypothetical protein
MNSINYEKWLYKKLNRKSSTMLGKCDQHTNQKAPHFKHQEE